MLKNSSNLNVPGIYVLVLEIRSRVCLDINSLGKPCIASGLYGYVGSARGFGGIGARLKHHLRKNKKRLWWHIDYLTTRQEVVPIYIIYAETAKDFEEKLANAIATNKCWDVGVLSFGSSDKNSLTHLFKCVCSRDQCFETLLEIFNFLGLKPFKLSLEESVHH